MGNGASAQAGESPRSRSASVHGGQAFAGASASGAHGAPAADASVSALPQNEGEGLASQLSRLSSEAEGHMIENLLSQTQDATSAWQKPEAPKEEPYWAETLAAFDTEFEGEIAFDEGEALIVLGEPNGDGWVEARLGDEIGCVPETYIAKQLMRPAHVIAATAGAAKVDLAAAGVQLPPHVKTSRPLEIEEGDLVGVLDEAVATVGGQVFAYVIQEPTSRRAVGPGLVPAEHLRLAAAAMVATSFQAAPDSDLELELLRGQRVWVLDAEPRGYNGWADLMTMEGGRGYAPASCVRLEAMPASGGGGGGAAGGPTPEPDVVVVAGERLYCRTGPQRRRRR